jgi:hypothetical protein
MRLFEFASSEGNETVGKLLLLLRNYRGRAASKKTPARLNWRTIEKLTGIEIDNEIFQSVYDDPKLGAKFQELIKDFDANGIELRVPGTDSTETKNSGVKGQQDSQAAVDKIAASSAPQQLSQQTQSIS